MAPGAPREAGVWRQTRALLFKNCLIKCRTKKSSVQVKGAPASLNNSQIMGKIRVYFKAHEDLWSALNFGVKWPFFRRIWHQIEGILQPQNLHSAPPLSCNFRRVFFYDCALSFYFFFSCAGDAFPVVFPVLADPDEDMMKLFQTLNFETLNFEIFQIFWCRSCFSCYFSCFGWSWWV